MPDRPQPTGPVEVFYSYAHEDEKLKDELLKHLSNIERQGIILSWHDRKITAGREWAGAIDERINTAGLILLFVSPDFMASGYCNDVELARAMQRHEAGEARVVPVILRPVDWKGAPFEKLRALPTDGRPVTRRRNRDEALLEVAQGIREAVEEIAKRPIPKPPRKIPEPIIPRPPVVGFVSRRDKQGSDIIGRLKEALAPEKKQLVALWGPGGSGKTTLAAEFARDTKEVFSGRVAWVSALGRAKFGLATLLDEIATKIDREDIRRLAPEAKAAQVAALVSGEPTLVVLDNFETISGEEQARCLDFLAQGAACPVLITTRARVNSDDVYNVPLDAMTLEEARDFLQRLVGRTRKPTNFDLLDRDDLIRRCEANPLVLQWVVHQIDLAKRPQDVLDDLARGEGDAAERVFTRSFNLPQLGDDGRAVLLALSLFTPDASRESLAQVSGFGDDLHRLNKAVERLSALWLIEATEGNERLFLRGLTRELAKARLSQAEYTTEFRPRYIEYFLRFAQSHAKRNMEDLDILESEKDNLSGAIDVAFAERDWLTVMLIRHNINHFLYLRGYWNEAVKSGKQAKIAACEAKSDGNTAYFTMCVALIHKMRMEYEEAMKGYAEALNIARRLGHDENISACLTQLGGVALQRGELQEARQLINESLVIKNKLGDKTGLALAIWGLGNISLEEGNFDEAKRSFTESLNTFIELQDRVNAAGVMNQLAILAELQSDTEEARRLWKESLEIKKMLGDQYGIAGTLGNLGLLAEKEGDKAEAVRLLRESLRIFEKLGSHAAKKARRDLNRVESGPG